MQTNEERLSGSTAARRPAAHSIGAVTLHSRNLIHFGVILLFGLFPCPRILGAAQDAASQPAAAKSATIDPAISLEREHGAAPAAPGEAAAPPPDPAAGVEPAPAPPRRTSHAEKIRQLEALLEALKGMPPQ